jgi:hypothetical protein
MTEAIVQIAARRQIRSGRAIIMGISMMSGGIGKNELSAKDTTASAGSAFGPRAAVSMRS